MNPWVRSTLFGCGGFLAGFGGCLLRRRVLQARRGNVAPVALALAICPGTPLFPQNATACVNVERTTLDAAYEARQEYTHYSDKGWFTGTVRNALKAKPTDDPHLKPNPAAYTSPPEPGVLDCDEAARMILRGDPAGALELLKQVESAHPGLYLAAANMGTAYELTGDDENALKWINEGIKRYPASHMLAEWLHVKILEAKIALKQDPEWLKRHTITGFDPGLSSFPTLQGTRDGMGVMRSMRSQATVRALFIKPDDIIISHLLLEAAWFALKNDPGSTLGILDLAVEYGLPEQRTQALREAYQEKREAAFQKSGPLGTRARILEYLPCLVFALSGLAGVMVARPRQSRKPKARRSSLDHAPNFKRMHMDTHSTPKR
jgi:hypothetical protein